MEEKPIFQEGLGNVSRAPEGKEEVSSESTLDISENRIRRAELDEGRGKLLEKLRKLEEMGMLVRETFGKKIDLGQAAGEEEKLRKKINEIENELKEIDAMSQRKDVPTAKPEMAMADKKEAGTGLEKGEKIGPDLEGGIGENPDSDDKELRENIKAEIIPKAEVVSEAGIVPKTEKKSVEPNLENNVMEIPRPVRNKKEIRAAKKTLNEYRFELGESEDSRARKIIIALSSGKKENWEAMKNVTGKDTDDRLAPIIRGKIEKLNDALVESLGKDFQFGEAETVLRWIFRVAGLSLEREQKQEKLAA